MNREVEVKARLKNREAVTAKLRELGCTFYPPVSQKDIVYTLPGSSIPLPPGGVALRLRTQDGRSICTTKKTISNNLDCDEAEFDVSNPEELLHTFSLLGFTEFSRVHKVRQKAAYQNMEICLDEVEGLGSYIEVERLTDGENSAQIQKELFEFLQTLGVAPEDQETNGYDILIKLKQQTTA